ncbi:MAG: hypothetical protein PHO84_05780 [Dysgonamonadaceae bacterium]|nr:hypothetical protein [Dysgonamonadaceae bacterium]MDD4605561.1 hypothetical protein [Dysgonamonadaceae bacterium]HTN68793.1 hypothetical protein [Dysgonamonadaceae bacterium]
MNVDKIHEFYIFHNVILSTIPFPSSLTVIIHTTDTILLESQCPILSIYGYDWASQFICTISHVYDIVAYSTPRLQRGVCGQLFITIISI